MTRDEKRDKLEEAMHTAWLDSPPRRSSWLAALDAIAAAGYCVVDQEATEEMIETAWRTNLAVNANEPWPCWKTGFRAMALKGNLAGKRDEK